MSIKVAVVGQGYVGLPLALAAAEAGYEVVGIDHDVARVTALNKGNSPIGDVSDSYLAAQARYRASTDFGETSGSDVVVLCLPTPLDSEGNPDHSFLLAGARAASLHLSDSTLVINESTVSPGYTREVLGKLFANCDLAYSPERIDPANKIWNVRNTPKLVSGLTEASTNRAVEFYSKFVSSIISHSSVEVVETAKLLENSFRLVNISFVNEISDFCAAMKIDIEEVIAMASTKPYGFMPFFPSAGVGGHCIPVDPIFLSAKAREIGAPSRFIDLANQINRERACYFVGVATGLLGSLSGRKVIVVGVAYKPDVADVRETPAARLISELRNQAAEVFWHDDLVGTWQGENSVDLSENYDLAILVNPHTGTDLSPLGSIPMIDTRGGY
jgi:UDP-N-acetyl-D-glucosamine dehydrogenase